MSDGLLTVLAVFGLLVLFEVLDISKLIRKRLRGEVPTPGFEERIRDLETRISALEKKASPPD